MRPFLLIALLIGTQVGLSDGLLLPALSAEHGQGSFLLAYGFFKVLFILPILQAELVAGRIYRVSPFDISFLVLNRTLSTVLFVVILAALLFVLSTNLFNSAWTLVFSIDGLRGELLQLRPLDQNLYWFEQSQNIPRLMLFVLMQGVLLMLLGGLAWRGIAALFVFFVPIVFAFILYSLPDIVRLLAALPYPSLSVANVLAALQHAITSSLAGLLIWYVIGTKVSDQLPTGRVIIGVQLVDLLFGLALYAISFQWMHASDGVNDVSTVMRSLMESLALADQVPQKTWIWLSLMPLVGVLSSVPLLLLVAQHANSQRSGQWLLAVTMLLVMVLSAGLVLSHGMYSPLVWYDMPLYDVVQTLGHGVLVPLIMAVASIWVGWFIWPNRLLKQINPHGGFRYFLWRLVLRFVVPVALGVIFAGNALQLVTLTVSEVIVFVLLLLTTVQLFKWVKKRAILPFYD